jgi:AraC-like DNA-binding protein
LAKIAVKSDVAPASAPVPASTPICAGEGWSIFDVVCGAGPADRPFEEQHANTTIAIVVAGTFEYRSSTGRELMTPGSLLLGNRGDCFVCGHEHGKGDRCISIVYTADYFGWIAEDAGAGDARFRIPRLAPAREFTAPVTRAATLLRQDDAAAGWEDLSFELAAKAIGAGRGPATAHRGAEPSSLARVTRVVRMIENDLSVPHDLASLAGVARLSPFHFLRVFEQVTGTTPHQYVLRYRLRRAATRLATERTKIAALAFDCGFGDVSNFNRAFRMEFGVNPRAFRRCNVG